MKQDRSNWTVRKVTFEEAEKLDDEYYAGLSEAERLEILMDLRSMAKTDDDKVKPVFFRRHIHDDEEI